MQRLEDCHEIEAVGERRLRSVEVVELHAVFDVGAGEIALRIVDGRLVEVDPVDRDLRVRARDRDARPAGTARDIRDVCGRIAGESLMDLRNRRQPLAAEQIHEHRVGGPSLRDASVVAVAVERESSASSEGLNHLVDRPDAGDGGLSQGRSEVQAGLVEQHLVVPGREAEAPLVIHGEDSRRRLVLEPFARVAFVDTGGVGEFGGSGRPSLGEHAIKPKPIA